MKIMCKTAAVLLSLLGSAAAVATLSNAESLKAANFWRGELGTSLDDEFLARAERCSDSPDTLCLADSRVRLSIQRTRRTAADGVECSNVRWEAIDCSVTALEDCMALNTAHWYGGTTIRRMTWPIETWSFRSFPYVTGDAYTTPAEYGGVQERYWLTSNGTAFFVDWETPLWLSVNSLNNGRICFKAQYADSPYFNHDDAPLTLNYTVCQGNDVRHVHDYMAATYIAKPTDIPDEQLFRYPIWSTWAQYKQDVTQDKVIEFAAAINANGFSHSQVEIDDRWERYYGDMEFDWVKFPDPKRMVDTLTEMGFRTTIWVHPFVNMDSPELNDGIFRFAYVSDPGRALPALTSWWAGNLAMILDFTTTRAVTWFTNRLRALQTNYNISSFKFDAGESNWLPNCYLLAEPRMRNPSYYSARYAEAAYALDSDVRHQEVRVGARTQHIPVFVRMMDKDSQWGVNNGLETLIPHTINFGLIGYPFVLPDMVGGNGYQVLPDRELFIRWVELNVFLPSIQFSIAPWQFDAELLDITRRMVALHERYAPTFIALAREATLTGAPIVRPLWWVAPLDPTALVIDSEFLVGDDLLVAPVVKQGARARDVYLPAGRWHDELRDEELEGGVWYMDYRVELDELPYFTRV